MVGSLAGRYLAQQAVKLVPVVGWLVSGAIGAGSTWLLGQATVIYFESGGDMTLNRYVQQAGQKIRRYQQTWQFGYDNEGILTSATTPSGRVTTYTLNG